MRVLVTGHRGYIGTLLVPMLLEKGHEVAGLDSDIYEASRFRDLGFSIDETRKDIRDADLADVSGFDAVLHLAALSNDPLGELDPKLTDEINHKASVRLASLAKEAGAQHFVFSSSCSNYGAAGDDAIDETAAFSPVTPYGRSKVDAELGIGKLADERFHPVFLRSATAYGVSPKLRFDLVLNNLVAWAVTTGRVYLKGDGTAWRPIVHVSDIARAFVAVLEAPTETVHARAFNVGRTSENYRIRELAEIVAETVPDSRIEYAPGAAPDKRCYRVTCDRIIAEVPTFQPQWDARSGARELYEAYREAGFTQSDFEGARYNRVQHVRELIAKGRLDRSLRRCGATAAASA